MSQSLKVIDSYNPSLPPTEDNQSIESVSYGRIGLHYHGNKIKYIMHLYPSSLHDKSPPDIRQRKLLLQQ